MSVDDEMKQVHRDRQTDERTDGQTYSLRQHVIGTDRVRVRVTVGKGTATAAGLTVSRCSAEALCYRFERSALSVSRDAHKLSSTEPREFNTGHVGNG